MTFCRFGDYLFHFWGFVFFIFVPFNYALYIGRKNWLFSNTPKGADASAVIYSLIETAKENDLNPFPYLQYLFEQLPNVDIQEPERLKKYLPWSKELPSICRNLQQ